MASELASKTCVPCRGGVPPLKGPELGALRERIDGWDIVQGLCQVKAESGTIGGWNHNIEGIAFHLKSSATLSGCTIGSH